MARSVLIMKASIYNRNLPSFLKLLKYVSFLKEQVPVLSILSPIFTQILIYIGKGTACTCYAIDQTNFKGGSVYVVQLFFTIIKFEIKI